MGNEQTSTFDLTNIQQAMGVRSRIVNPQVSEGIGLVLTVGDMSKSFGSQKFEARGVATAITPNVALEGGYLELHSVAAGGIVIEGFDVHSDDLTVFSQFTIFDTQIVNGTASTGFLQQVGGQPLSTTVVGGTALIAGFPTPSITIFRDTIEGSRFTENQLEWFIPSGNFAAIWLAAAAVSEFQIRFREIPQSAGPQ